jgi:hypothetical protein
VRPAQRAGEVEGRGNAKSPNDGDLKNADLRARQYSGAHAAAAEEDEEERAEKYSDKPLRWEVHDCLA